MSEEYGVIRRAKRPDTGYLWVLNSVARDQRVSRRARGLLIEMLSYPDDWDFDRDWLAAQSAHEGQHAIRNALIELEQFGYLERRRVRLPGGRFGWEHTLYDSPQEVSAGQTTGQESSSGHIPAGQRVSAAHTTGRFSTDGPPTDGVPTGGKRPSYEGLSRRTVTKEELPPLASLAGPHAEALPGMPESKPAPTRKPKPTHPVDEFFEIFWKIYPRRTAKDAALKAWIKAVSRADAETIIEGARRYAADPNREAEFTAHPATWLNGGRWGDDPIPPRNGRPGNGGSSRLSVALDVTRQMQAEEEGLALQAPVAAINPPPRWTNSYLEQGRDRGYRS